MTSVQRSWSSSRPGLSVSVGDRGGGRRHLGGGARWLSMWISTFALCFVLALGAQDDVVLPWQGLVVNRRLRGSLLARMGWRRRLCLQRSRRRQVVRRHRPRRGSLPPVALEEVPETVVMRGSGLAEAVAGGCPIVVACVSDP